MCRLAAFPPNFSRAKAIEILLECEACNTDGTGYTYINDGKFVTHKWPRALSSLLKRGKPSILGHMPHPTWTIVHLRAASHGANTLENTHPFEIADKWAICHNGIWNDYDVAKLALTNYVQFKGETDSEVAAHLFNNLGPKKFAQEIKSGVYLGLNLDGSLWVAMTSGELVLNSLKDDQVLIASELSHEKYPDQADAIEGWYHFNTDGTYNDHKANPLWYTAGNYSNFYGSSFGKGVCVSDHRDFGKIRIHSSPTGVSAVTDCRDWHDY